MGLILYNIDIYDISKQEYDKWLTALKYEKLQHSLEVEHINNRINIIVDISDERFIEKSSEEDLQKEWKSFISNEIDLIKELVIDFESSLDRKLKVHINIQITILDEANISLKKQKGEDEFK